MTKLYTIVQIGYEYNDEIMYQPESGGGTPVSAYSTRERAQEEINKMNRKEINTLISSSELSSYGYEWDDILNISPKTIGISSDLYDFTDHDFDNLTVEQQERFYEYINLNFYEVYEIEVVN